MKLRNRTILAVALAITACTGTANAGKLHKPAAPKAATPVVPLPTDAPRSIPTPMGGPTVALPVRQGIDVANTPPSTPVAMSTSSAPAPAMVPAPQPMRAPATAPKVTLPVDSNVSPVHTKEAGPVVPLPQ